MNVIPLSFIFLAAQAPLTWLVQEYGKIGSLPCLEVNPRGINCSPTLFNNNNEYHYRANQAPNKPKAVALYAYLL